MTAHPHSPEATLARQRARFHARKTSSAPHARYIVRHPFPEKEKKAPRSTYARKRALWEEALEQYRQGSRNVPPKPPMPPKHMRWGRS